MRGRECSRDSSKPRSDQVSAEIGPSFSEPVKVQLDRVFTQMYGLQQRLDALIARRNEAIAERASRHVASIVAAAEKSAAEIRAGAQNDAARVRKRLLADVQAEVAVVRSAAHADAARIRAEANAQAARARDEAITEASAEIQDVCSRLSDELQRAASTGIARVRGGERRPTSAAPATRVAGLASDRLRQPAVEISAPARSNQIAHEVAGAVDEFHEVAGAVDELQNAATVLERSLRNLREGAAEPQRAGAT
jgi:phage host-nuclease inhibitor protein Gam